jgi:hypothetical protein
MSHTLLRDPFNRSAGGQFRYTNGMQVTLSPHGEELLRDALARHPGTSPAEIVEAALAEQIGRDASPGPVPAAPVLSAAKIMTPEEFDRWLDDFRQFSDRIPLMPGETFSREMIYQDCD